MPTLPQPATLRLAFLTLPGYSFVSVAPAIEALQMANTVCGRKAFSWVVASTDGRTVTASNGLTLGSTEDLRNLGRCDIVLVCGGNAIQEACTDALVHALRRAALVHGAMGGLCTGAYALAKAGLLNQYKASIHWESRFAAQELFTRVVFTDKLFVVDRDRYTCAAGTAALHLMLKLVKERCGAATATTVAEQLGLERIRDENERQHTPMQSRVGSFQAHLIEVAQLMEANIAEPLSLTHIAELVGISRRQLERLFKRYVGEIPTRYYMGLRLRHARHLVLQSTLSMGDIALACGFSNGAYFSRCYRELFGITPRAERLGEAAPGNTPPMQSPSGLGIDIRKLGEPGLQPHPSLNRQLNVGGPRNMAELYCRTQ